MQPNQAAWFAGAPVSRFIAVMLVVSHLVIYSRGPKALQKISSSTTGDDFQWYKLITSKLLFRTTAETVTATITLSLLTRRFEREMGSPKFFAILILTNIITIVLESTALLVFDRQEVLYSGPYPWIGACLALFYRFSPRMYPRFISILGLNFSEKAITYAFSLYVAGNGGLTTIIPTALGAMSIFVLTPLLDHKTPSVLAKLYPGVIFSVLSDPPPRIYAPLMLAQMQGRRGGGAMRGMEGAAAPRPTPRRPVAPPTPPAPPPEEAVEQLTAMGFGRQEVVQALQATSNNVERAANILLSG
jgi:membrane associated rhomboid family serine protease